MTDRPSHPANARRADDRSVGAATHHLRFMGAAYWIPAFWVPALLVTH